MEIKTGLGKRFDTALENPLGVIVLTICTIVLCASLICSLIFISKNQSDIRIGTSVIKESKNDFTASVSGINQTFSSSSASSLLSSFTPISSTSQSQITIGDDAIRPSESSINLTNIFGKIKTALADTTCDSYISKDNDKEKKLKFWDLIRDSRSLRYLVQVECGQVNGIFSYQFLSYNHIEDANWSKVMIESSEDFNFLPKIPTAKLKNQIYSRDLGGDNTCTIQGWDFIGGIPGDNDKPEKRLIYRYNPSSDTFKIIKLNEGTNTEGGNHYDNPSRVIWQDKDNYKLYQYNCKEALKSPSLGAK